ncbi:MAG TPA: DUF4344 domain-containing metallopeptidase, partial [Pyrinomonadaceae bacterium]|nr:DUF4344 domain-containing metallopeptidase [Pyrinomonadaceae bacterium]
FVKQALLSVVLLVCPLGAARSSTLAKRQPDSSSKAQRNAAAPTPVAAHSRLQAKAAAEDKGDFRLVYVPLKDKGLAHIEKMIKDSKLFESLIETSNKELALPVDITVYFRECTGKNEDGTPEDPTNAWYNPDDHSITMCYGLVKQSEDLFKDDEKDEKELEEAVLGSTAWTFYHEMGHALIDVYKIAHTGKEEDAADELSTYILINEGGEEGELAALNGAENFYREAAEDNDLGEDQFADSHSLDKQRFYNVICWVYGSNTKKYAELTKGKDPILPEGRADGCEQEYERITKAWQALLGPHLKK